MHASPTRPTRPDVDAGRLWAGGTATAVVAGLIGLVGVLVAQGMLDLDMADPPLLPIGSSFAVQYALTAAALALVATGIAHLLALSTPRPQAFLSWIIGLATVVGVVLPFTLDATTAGRIATAIVDLVIGMSIGSLLHSVLIRTIHRGVPLPPPGAPMPPVPGPPPPPPYV
jgi:Family of unknown function (DUF6069)